MNPILVTNKLSNQAVYSYERADGRKVIFKIELLRMNDNFSDLKDGKSLPVKILYFNNYHEWIRLVNDNLTLNDAIDVAVDFINAIDDINAMYVKKSNNYY